MPQYAPISHAFQLGFANQSTEMTSNSIPEDELATMVDIEGTSDSTSVAVTDNDFSITTAQSVWSSFLTPMNPTPIIPALPVPNTDSSFTFPQLPGELQRMIWRIAVRDSAATGRIVKLDEPNRGKIYPLLSVYIASREETLKEYTHLHNQGVTNESQVIGPSFDIYVKYDKDTIVLMDQFDQNPIDRGLVLYQAWLQPVKQLALNPRWILRQQLARGSGRNRFWGKVMRACPNLEKLITYDIAETRSTFPPDIQPSSRGMQTYYSWHLRVAYLWERLQGRLVGVDLEQKAYLND